MWLKKACNRHNCAFRLQAFCLWFIAVAALLTIQTNCLKTLLQQPGIAIKGEYYSPHTQFKKKQKPLQAPPRLRLTDVTSTTKKQ